MSKNYNVVLAIPYLEIFSIKYSLFKVFSTHAVGFQFQEFVKYYCVGKLHAFHFSLLSNILPFNHPGKGDQYLLILKLKVSFL